MSEMNVEAERADFEVWAELTDHQKHGANHEVIGWYYFEEVTQDKWEAWQASAARRAAQPADVGATELPELPEPCQSVMPSGWIRYTADQMLDYARAALAHKAAPAPAADQDALDAKRWRYIEEHATTHGGGDGFTITCFVPFDEEDMGVGIDRTMAATPVTDQPKQENQQ